MPGFDRELASRSESPSIPRATGRGWRPQNGSGAPENAEIVQAAANLIGAGAEPPAVTGFTPRMFLAPRALDVMIGVRPGNAQDMASEWDFAVADLVFHEAGGVVTDLAGQRFRYNKPTPHNVGGLIAAVDPLTHARVADALRAVRR